MSMVAAHLQIELAACELVICCLAWIRAVPMPPCPWLQHIFRCSWQRGDLLLSCLDQSTSSGGLAPQLHSWSPMLLPPPFSRCRPPGFAARAGFAPTLPGWLRHAKTHPACGSSVDGSQPRASLHHARSVLHPPHQGSFFQPWDSVPSLSLSHSTYNIRAPVCPWVHVERSQACSRG